MEDPEYGVVPPESQRTTQRRPVKNIQINNTVPTDILQNEALNKAVKTLPSNYSFEIHKTLWRIRKNNSKRVALQFPEGLLMYSCIISDILQTFGNVETVILGDVTYGACCIDDLSAISLGCDFLVHYGHSCLVPIDICQIPTLYVFVDIVFNSDHLIAMLLKHLDPTNTHLILAGTIQFSTTIQLVQKIIQSSFKSVTVPQSKPLSQGEVLGCTSPKLAINPNANSQSKVGSSAPEPTSNAQCGKGGDCCQEKQNDQKQQQTTTSTTRNQFVTVEDIQGNMGHGATPEGIPLDELEQDDDHQVDDQSASSCSNPNLPIVDGATSQDNVICVFIADGRFHLESLMIQNAHIPRFLRYDPYNRMLTEESYDYTGMHERRYTAIQVAKKATKWGVILGTLGRQGSTHILDRIEQCLKNHNCEFVPILLSEIFPSKLSILATQCDAWVQIACPRLSIDWASGFTQPLLSPYEFFVCFSELDEAARSLSPVPASTAFDSHNNNNNDPRTRPQSTPPPLPPLATKTEWLPDGVYPMDYYSSNGGEWTNYYHRQMGQPDVIGGPNDPANDTAGKTKMSGRDALALLRAKRAQKQQEQFELKVQEQQGQDNKVVDAVVQPLIKTEADSMD